MWREGHSRGVSQTTAAEAPNAIKRAVKNLRTAGLDEQADKLAKEYGITE